MNSLQRVVNEGGFISNNVNQIGGMNSMSLSHDPWSQSSIVQRIPGATQITIPPAIAIQYCATFPSVCGVLASGSFNSDFVEK